MAKTTRKQKLKIKNFGGNIYNFSKDGSLTWNLLISQNLAIWRNHTEIQSPPAPGQGNFKQHTTFSTLKSEKSIIMWETVLLIPLKLAKSTCFKIFPNREIWYVEFVLLTDNLYP